MHAYSQPTHCPFAGERYCYQQLLLKTPFRDSMPRYYISSTNGSGTLREECERRRIIPTEANGGLAARVATDAAARYFPCETITAMLVRLDEHEKAMTSSTPADDTLERTAARLDVDEDDVVRLTAAIEKARQPVQKTEAPIIELRWEQTDAGGDVQVAYWVEKQATEAVAGTAEVEAKSAMPATEWPLRQGKYAAFQQLRHGPCGL